MRTIFEVTVASSWASPTAGSLLWRLEERLHVSLQCATALQDEGEASLNITDVVAVVLNCKRSVGSLMAREGAPPLLRQLMKQGRFVFVYLHYGDQSEGGSTRSGGGAGGVRRGAGGSSPSGGGAGTRGGAGGPAVIGHS